MSWCKILELINSEIVYKRRLTYCKVEYAIKACHRMKKKDSNRVLWIAQLRSL